MWRWCTLTLFHVVLCDLSGERASGWPSKSSWKLHKATTGQSWWRRPSIGTTIAMLPMCFGDKESVGKALEGFVRQYSVHMRGVC